MTTLTVSQARAHLSGLITKTSESHQPIHIIGRLGSAVLVSAQDWEAIQETLRLASAPGMVSSIRQGMAAPLKKSARKLTW